jgi:hypothetical protein
MHTLHQMKKKSQVPDYGCFRYITDVYGDLSDFKLPTEEHLEYAAYDEIKKKEVRDRVLPNLDYFFAYFTTLDFATEGTDEPPKDAKDSRSNSSRKRVSRNVKLISRPQSRSSCCHKSTSFHFNKPSFSVRNKFPCNFHFIYHNWPGSFLIAHIGRFNLFQHGKALGNDRNVHEILLTGCE